MKYRITKWHDYQHYKDRLPPWIKLHQSILTSETWVVGDDASRVLMIASMLLASRNMANDGTFNGDPTYVQRFAYLHKKPDFKPLIDNGFLEVEQDASSVLAKCNTEERREEKNICANDDSFAKFWESYPKKKNKADALKAWKAAKVNGDFDKIMSALEQHKKNQDWLKDDGTYIPYPASWIRGKRWEDETASEEDWRKDVI